MTKYKGTKPSETARPPHQFNLSQAEFDSIYELADLPKQVSKGAALRQALLNHRDQITENAKLLSHIKQLTEFPKVVNTHLTNSEIKQITKL